MTIQEQSISQYTANGMPNPAMLTITPETAQRWLETMLYEHQRPIRQSHVEYLAEEMRRGRFVQGLQMHIVEYENASVLVDGYHRLWAIVESGLSQTVAVLRTRVATKEEIAWIYGNTDIGMRRTGAQLIGALELPQEIGCSIMEVRQLSGAIPFMLSGCVRTSYAETRYHKDDLIHHIRLYAPYARSYFAQQHDMSDTLRKRANRSSTLSIALLTWRYAAPYAESRGDPSVAEFWRGVLFDDGVQIGDPRKLVNRHLLMVNVSASASSVHSSGELVTTGYSARYIAACFNAYMERRQLKMAKVNDATAPIRLYGVPNDPANWWK